MIFLFKFNKCKTHLCSNNSIAAIELRPIHMHGATLALCTASLTACIIDKIQPGECLRSTSDGHAYKDTSSWHFTAKDSIMTKVLHISADVTALLEST